MKAVTIRYTLKAKSKILEERTRPELVLAEVSGAFSSQLNGITNYSKFQFSLETHIAPKYFGIIKEKRGVKNYVFDISTITYYDKYNKVLRNKINDFKSHIENAETYFKDQNPTAAEFKEHLNKITGRIKRKPVPITLIKDFLNAHIKYLENIIGTGRKDEVEDTTINSYRNLKPLIERFEEAKQQLTFEKLDEKCYREIWDTANDIRTGVIKIKSYELKPRNPYKTNSLKSYQTYFIKLCKLASRKGIEIPLDLSDENLINRSEKKPSEKTDAFLTEADILKIINYNPDSDSLKLAKNYIILASLFGMRYQSMIEANGRAIEFYSENSYNFYYLHVIQGKTKTECYTPIFHTALEIIQNNNYLFLDFTKITLANLNRNIRKAMRLSEIKNYKLFSSHNLRSTFVTNLSLLNVDESKISLITHPKKNKEGNVSIYNKKDMLANAQSFADAIIKANKEKKSKLYSFDKPKATKRDYYIRRGSKKKEA